MWGTETQPCIRRRRQLPGTPFAVGTGLCLARTTVSRRSQVAYIGWMLAKFPSRGRPNSRAISESADEPQTLLRDSGIADGQSFFSLLAWENWSSPKAVAVVMSARVRTSLLPPLSPSVQGRTEVRVIEPLPTCAAGLLHGWIVRWPMTHLCRNPQTVGRGSARLLRKGRGMSGQCKGNVPLSDGLGIHCQQAEIFLIIA